MLREVKDCGDAKHTTLKPNSIDLLPSESLL